MKRAPLVASVLFLAVAGRAADLAAPSRAGFVGEGGAYKDADRTTSQYMQGGLSGIGNLPASAPAPSPAPASSPSAHPADPASASAPSHERSAAPATAAASAAPSSPSVAARTTPPGPSNASRAVAGPSLWNGIVSPLDMTADRAATAEPGAAREGAGRDYETRILGYKDSGPRPALGAVPGASDAPQAAPGRSVSSRPGGNNVFVSLVMDPREAGSLRDAVAGLGSSVGFFADTRFEALAGPGGTARISGWIPADRLGEALGRPGVKRLMVETQARPSAPSETRGAFLVGLRLDGSARARAQADAGVRALASSSGFRLTRIVGVETAPDGSSVALAEGTLPLSKLSVAMALSEVVKISPISVSGQTPAPASPAPAPASGAKRAAGFARFAMDRSPWLILLTLLLALPSLRAPARRAAAVFNPYR